nr:MFS transporter [Sporolactobacillus mangiferae]
MNFSMLLFGRLISNIGDSMYYIAAMWLVYTLGGSAFYSGIAGFLTLAPQAFQFITGPIIDRHSIRNLLVATQLIQALLLCTIPIAYAFHFLSVTMIFIIMPLAAFLNQFSLPAENALIPQILPKEQRVTANSLMAVSQQGSDAAFNALSGALVASVGAITLYMADIVTFLLAALLFSAIKLQYAHEENKSAKTIQEQTRRYFNDLKEGFLTVFRSILGKMLVASAITNFVFGAMMASLPAYSDTLGGSEIFGFLLAGMSIGSLIGAGSAGLFKRFAFGRLMIVGYFLGFSFWFASACIPYIPFKIILFSISMIPIGLSNVLSFVFMQNVIPQKMLARSISVITSISSCMMPIGSLIGGVLSTLFRPQIIFAATSSSLLFISVYLLCVPLLRRIPSVQSIQPEQYGFHSDSPSGI